jgi:hypothetical protein
MKPVIIRTEENEVYTLEFTRASVRRAEAAGFALSDLNSRPVTAILQLFYFAFGKNHATVSVSQAEKLWDQLPGGEAREKLLRRLVEMFTETYETLTSGDDNAKNATVTVEM